MTGVFEKRLRECALATQACLDGALASAGDLPVAQGMRYASAGGKRLRAFLVMESAALHEVSDAQSVWAAAAIEAMHAYSLVHDDLPCMDDDDLRRGQPTVHRKWDEGTAVLVGDALQCLSFELLTRPQLHPDAGVRLDLVGRLAQASGVEGMVLGQALDIAAETAKTPLSWDEITRLQDRKTGALIIWSAKAGPILAARDTTAMRVYAAALGLAFQIADDIMDIEGDAGKAGKRLQKDAEAGKATFVSLLGLEGAKRRAAELVDQASDALSGYGGKAETLREAARFVISRDM